uniref:Uncharacterized protein n=1 Tax=Timema douglasi TaxID=61478 RepID=A0A7R8VTQ6_TIMDO|nr:unnamed protein product [Timema douglasi]
MVKRKLLDSRMVSIYGEEWLEFNVKSAARVWRESGKNFGLSIQVEDEDNQVLPAVKYFSFMDCSNEAFIATARPIPGFLVNAARDYILESTRNETNTRRSNTIYLDSLMFPMIDLFTIEMPEHEMVDAALLYQTRLAHTFYELNIAGEFLKVRHLHYMHRRRICTTALLWVKRRPLGPTKVLTTAGRSLNMASQVDNSSTLAVLTWQRRSEASLTIGSGDLLASLVTSDAMEDSLSTTRCLMAVGEFRELSLHVEPQYLLDQPLVNTYIQWLIQLQPGSI